MGFVTVFNANVDVNILVFTKEKDVFIDVDTKSKWDITGYCYAGKIQEKQLQIAHHINPLDLPTSNIKA